MNVLLQRVQKQMERLQLLAATGPPGGGLGREQRELLYRSSTSELLLDHWMTKAIFYSQTARKSPQASATLGDLWREVGASYQAHRVVVEAVIEQIAHFDAYTMHFAWNRATKPFDRLAGWAPSEKILELPGAEGLQALLTEFIHDLLGPLRSLLGMLLSKAEVVGPVLQAHPLFPNFVRPTASQALTGDEGSRAVNLFEQQFPSPAEVRRQVLGYKAGLLHSKQHPLREEDLRILNWQIIFEYERLAEASLEECLSRAGEQSHRRLLLIWRLGYRALYTVAMADLHRSILGGPSGSIVVPAAERVMMPSRVELIDFARDTKKT